MKHVISISNETANCKITIRLNDECRNGHEDFAITANFWEIGRAQIDRNLICGGCCHEDILRIRPDLKIFVDLHLCDFKGAPMSAVSNGWYHAVKAEYHSQEAGPKSLAKYYGINEDLAKKLCNAEDKGHFAMLVWEYDVPKIWLDRAKKGIKILEQFTGEKFTSKATKSHYENPSTEQIEEYRRKKESGYYDGKNILNRKRDEERRKRELRLLTAKSEYENSIRKEKIEYEIKKVIFSKFNNDNFLYYSHNNTLNFNWLNHKRKFTQKEIDVISKKVLRMFPDTKITIEEKPL